MHEVFPNVFIGNFSDAFDLRAHQYANITAILNCTPDLKFAPFTQQRCRLPVQDNGDESQYPLMAFLLPQAVQWLRTRLAEGKNVLVHCAQGRQRSCCVVAAYAMATFGYTAQEAVQRVKEARREAFFPEANFMPALLDYERVLNKI